MGATIKKNIVIIEDSDFFRTTVKQAVLKAGFLPFVAESAEDILRCQKFNPSLSTPGMLDQMVPDLIILDLNLKKISGLELLKIFRGHEDYKDTPIIVNSSHSDKNTIIKTITSGANDYVLKEDKYVEILINKVIKFFEKELSTFETTLKHELEWIKFGNKELAFAYVSITSKEKEDDNAIGPENFKKIIEKLRGKLRSYDWIFPLDENSISVILPLSSVQSIVILRQKVLEEVKELSAKIKVPLNIQLGFSHFPTNAKNAKELISVAKGQIK